MTSDKKNRSGIFNTRQLQKLRPRFKRGDRFSETPDDHEDRAVQIIRQEDAETDKPKAKRRNDPLLK